jgi:hypothetical protein
MGLDMFLYKKTDVMQWDHKGNDNYKVEVTKGGKPTKIDPKKIAYIVEEVAYWRKANHIHNWFVNNVQNGTDDCGTYYVSREHLEELKTECQAVLNNPNTADKHLPCRSGFFFGSTDYDDDYYDIIKDTMKIIDDCLSDEDAEHFEYNASW